MPSRPFPTDAAARARVHPLVAAVLAALGARAVGLALHFFARDPNGNPISTSPIDNLMISVPYHGMVLATGGGVLLLAWKVARPARALVTLVGVALAMGVVALGQVDLAMQWFIGHRFSPNVAGTYVGGNLLSHDVIGPLSFHAGYVATGFALMLAPLVPITRSALAARRGVPLRPPGWGLILGLLLLGGAFRVPLALAFDPQLAVARPPELLFAFPVPMLVAPPDSTAAIADLRARIDPTGSSRWVDDAYPVARTTTLRNGTWGGRRPIRFPTSSSSPSSPCAGRTWGSCRATSARATRPPPTSTRSPAPASSSRAISRPAAPARGDSSGSTSGYGTTASRSWSRAIPTRSSTRSRCACVAPDTSRWVCGARILGSTTRDSGRGAGSTASARPSPRSRSASCARCPTTA